MPNMQVIQVRSLFRSRFLPVLVLLSLQGAVVQASEQAAVLVSGPAGSITALELNTDTQQRIPEKLRRALMEDPQKVEQMATSLYVRRALADTAEKQGLAQQGAVQAALRIARDKVLSDALIQQIRERHKLTDEVAEAHARNLYAAKRERFQHQPQVQVRHILVAGDTPESRAKAEQLLEQLKAGGDFIALAKENSADKASAVRGGDLGFFARGSMVPEFEAVAFALKEPGALSDVVQTKFGYHILKLEASRPAGVQPFAEVREALMAEVRGSVAQDAVVRESDAVREKVQPNEAAIRAFSEGMKEPE